MAVSDLFCGLIVVLVMLASAPTGLGVLNSARVLVCPYVLLRPWLAERPAGDYHMRVAVMVGERRALVVHDRRERFHPSWMIPFGLLLLAARARSLLIAGSTMCGRGPSASVRRRRWCSPAGRSRSRPQQRQQPSSTITR